MWQGSAGEGQAWSSKDNVPETAFYLHQAGSESQTWWGLLLPNGSSCWSLLLWWMGHCACVFLQWELSFGWWVLVLKSDDSRLKWISHLIQMLAVKNRSFWDRRDGTSVKGTYRCSIPFPASTWHQMELQLSATPSNALFWPLWCTGIHAGWTSVHLNGWKSPSG